VIPILEDLKKKARAEGLWNMFMPPNEHEDDEFHGAGLTNLEYALLAEQMGRVYWASEVFNCSAPDTGNMEVFAALRHRGAEGEVAEAADERRDPFGFLMTEPAVASSDATNIVTSIERDGDHYVINGRKWWSSGGRRSALQGRDPDGQDRSQRAAPPAAVADPGAARHAGHQS
jgi:acyl-CoA dehydrogenase